jgi:hypothetical protein
VILGFLSLAYFTLHDDIQFDPFSCKQHNFILLYGWTILHLYIYHIFFTYSSVVGHLGWFHTWVCSYPLVCWFTLLWIYMHKSGMARS